MIERNVNIYRNHQGKPVVNGRVMPTTPGEQRSIIATTLPPETEQPDFEKTLKDTIREVDAMLHANTLRPFVEGEAIGACPRRVRRRPLTKVEVAKEHNRRMERMREDMLALREQNIADIHVILDGRF